MSQERLSDLAVLSIENERARELDLSNIVESFAQQKARKWTSPSAIAYDISKFYRLSWLCNSNRSFLTSHMRIFIAVNKLKVH